MQVLSAAFFLTICVFWSCNFVRQKSVVMVALFASLSLLSFPWFQHTQGYRSTEWVPWRWSCLSSHPVSFFLFFLSRAHCDTPTLNRHTVFFRHKQLMFGRFKNKMSFNEEREAKLARLQRMKKIYLPPRHSPSKSTRRKTAFHQGISCHAEHHGENLYSS